MAQRSAADTPVEARVHPERRIFRRTWHLGEVLFWLACLVSYFLFPTHLLLLTDIFITGLLAVSLDLVVGFAGIISLGQAAFFGTGAYAAGLAAAHGWSEPLSGLAIAGLVSAVFGFGCAQLIARVDGIAALMITLGVNQLLFEAANRAVDITGGDDGLQGITIDPLLGRFSFDISGKVGFFYALIVLFLVFCLVRRLMRSPFGLALSGVRQNPRRMLMIGTSVRRHVIVVYTISAAIAGIAGGLLAQTTQFVGLDSIGVERSADVLVMLILGGVGWLYGGLIGSAVYLVAHDQFANFNPEYWLFWLGLLLVVVAVAVTSGSYHRIRSVIAANFRRGDS